MRSVIVKLITFLTMLMMSMPVFTARLMDLKNQPIQVLQSLTVPAPTKLRAAPTEVALRETSRYTDPFHITHIRMQEYYRNYPIWNAHAVVHMQAKTVKSSLPTLLRDSAMRKTMNGYIYQQLESDLEKAPSMVFDQAQAERAKQVAVDAYKSNRLDATHIEVKNTVAQLLVHVDKHQEAHWAFKIQFDVPPKKVSSLPAKPVYIIDAVHFKIYQHWDEVKTLETKDEFVGGGGFGGNQQIGQLSYDGLNGHLAAFTVKRSGETCYLTNNESVIMHAESRKIMKYPCQKKDANHNKLYWSGNFDYVNGAFSPANDAMFAAQVLKQFYKNWYNTPVLINSNGSEMVLHMNVHVSGMDNAYWYNNEMTFGDGKELYPLTSLGIAAHEVSHGFTEQHSNLVYDGESGGMNEAFSDMASQAAEYYAYGKSNWLVGNEIYKIDGETMRYMDQPSKDCYGKEPGTFCSIDNANQYYEGLNVHYSSGVYNRAFYLLSTTPGWDTRKAFAVMLHANASYWLQQTEYADGAACAVQAAADLKYDTESVEQAFKSVGIDVPQNCINSSPSEQST